MQEHSKRIEERKEDRQQRRNPLKRGERPEKEMDHRKHRQIDVEIERDKRQPPGPVLRPAKIEIDEKDPGHGEPETDGEEQRRKKRHECHGTDGKERERKKLDTPKQRQPADDQHGIGPKKRRRRSGKEQIGPQRSHGEKSHIQQSVPPGEKTPLQRSVEQRERPVENGPQKPHVKTAQGQQMVDPQQCHPFTQRRGDGERQKERSVEFLHQGFPVL